MRFQKRGYGLYGTASYHDYYYFQVAIRNGYRQRSAPSIYRADICSVAVSEMGVKAPRKSNTWRSRPMCLA
jgi:hypothetical protein